VVSPADGTVSDITILQHDPLIGGPAVRVGIFLSVFNVHVNRSPWRRESAFGHLQKGQIHQRDAAQRGIG